MQKLLELALNNLKHYLFSSFEISKPLHFYFRLISLLFIFCSLSQIYQYNDLILLDTPINPELNPFYVNYLNVFHFLSTDYAIFLLWLSIFTSIALFFLICPFWMLFANALIYSSLTFCFPSFMSFQWDILMIEILLLSMFLVSPFAFRINLKTAYSSSYLQLLPLTLLIVRLFYHSGYVKLFSNSTYWLNMSALEFHFFSQPMPHFLSYYIHKLVIFYNLSPTLIQLMLVTELLVPFGLLFHSYRKISASILIFFQLSIVFSGNYGFFNFLVIIPLLLLFLVNKSNGLYFFEDLKKGVRWIVLPVFFIFIFHSAAVVPYQTKSDPLLINVFKKFGLYNRYGLFARMTTNQTRFQVRLSRDGLLWDNLNLKYYDSKGFPTMGFFQPYHPRIRWQLWFKFLYIQRYPTWYMNFIEQLATNPNELTSIVKPNLAMGSNFNFVELCYQNIIFNYDSNDDSFWFPNQPKTCHIYNVKNKQFY